MTQTEAIERLAKWLGRVPHTECIAGCPCCAADPYRVKELYLDLLARNVAAMATEKREYMEGMGYTVNESPLLRAAVNVTHATIQSLDVDDE